MLLEEDIIFELQVLNEDYIFPCSPHPAHFSIPSCKYPLGPGLRGEERSTAEICSSGVGVGSQCPRICCESGTENEGPDPSVQLLSSFGIVVFMGFYLPRL